MSECSDCCGKVTAAPIDAQVRRILWIVLIANAAMFLIETIGGHAVGSLALQADALDFAADAATYGVTLWARRAIGARAHAGGVFQKRRDVAHGRGDPRHGGGQAGFRRRRRSRTDGRDRIHGAEREPRRCRSAAALSQERRQSALCLAMFAQRRFGNVLVMIAAAATAVTRSPWPDFAVGVIMSLLFLSGSWSVYRQARSESVTARAEMST
ncbi:MAG: cation transporter [Caulobacteraceae bacterium]|nr:cation transporter [Caulobacteraceae bacterium]